ncbi:MAG: guanylate kinase [Proteobacteria bacterium]|nr:guanylate kinase [Pseudomonadota bacterium]RZO98862.1 MAG: guanylate kinase [Gammaproteobacteria bacterium]|tara:strand:- start:4996 stop:5619 length:624 start_codon:yes stop_codon:yes gene_type:complete
MDKNLNNLFVISSPSGGGKSSLIEALLSDPNAKKLSLSISFTTRMKRSNERNGKNYYFIDNNEFKKKIKNNDFLESAEVFKNFYGTDKKTTEEILKTKDLLLELDWQGAFNIKKQFTSVKNIFLIPPSYNILKSRLKKRGTESEDSIIMRLSAAKEEISKYPFYDFLVLNDDFENALSDLKNIILKKTSKKEFKTRVSENLLKNLLD